MDLPIRKYDVQASRASFNREGSGQRSDEVFHERPLENGNANDMMLAD
jgi:hypothetical protein